jgi:predicted amidophosphoribosyltransferase
MAAIDVPRPALCLACAAPTDASDLCPACADAFSLARAAHPTSKRPLPPATRDDTNVLAATDMEFWDAWALLGDAGAHLRGGRN